MKKNSSRGFTLVELIVVMAVMGMIALTASPIFENLSSTRAEFAAYKVQSDIRYAQLLAIQTSGWTRIVFDLTAPTSYSLERDDGTGNFVPVVNPLTKENYTVNLGVNEYEGAVLTRVRFLGTSTQTLYFDQLGVPHYFDFGSYRRLGRPVIGGTNLINVNGKCLCVKYLTGKIKIENFWRTSCAEGLLP